MAGWPWYLVRAVLGVAPAALVAASAVLIIGGVGWWGIGTGRWPIAPLAPGQVAGDLPGTQPWAERALLVLAVVVGLLVVWFGPMSRTTRAGARYALAGVAPGRAGAVAVVLLALAGAAALATVILLGQDVVWWPLPGRRTSAEARVAERLTPSTDLPRLRVAAYPRRVTRTRRMPARTVAVLGVLALASAGFGALTRFASVAVHQCVADGTAGAIGLRLALLRHDAACPSGTLAIGGDGRQVTSLIVLVALPVLVVHLLGIAAAAGMAGRIRAGVHTMVRLPLAGLVARPEPVALTVLPLRPVRSRRSRSRAPIEGPPAGVPWRRGPPLRLA